MKTRASDGRADKSYVGMGVCPICGKDSGILMNMRLSRIFESGKRYAMPCAGCEEWLKRGVLFLVEVKDECADGEANPYRTGYLVGISREAAERLEIKGPMAYVRQSALKTYMGDQYGKQVEEPC